MPSKSHGGHKRSARSKKRKMKQVVSLGGERQQATTQNREPVSQVTFPSVKVLTPKPTPSSVAQRAYIATELRRIAILAGVMVIVLVLLYLVIH